MAINNNVNDGGVLPDIIMLVTQCYYHYLGTRLNAMKWFYLCSLSIIPPVRFDNFPPDWGALGRFRCAQILL